MTRLSASDRLQRLLALVPWVAAHDGPTVAEVCARFGLTADQLLDEIGLVSLVGVPPYTPDELFDVVVEDERVWVHLSPSFSRSLRLTPEQALALVAAGSSLRSVPGVDPDGPLARGLEKLAATLGVDAAELDVDLGKASATVLARLRSAIAARARVELDYYSHGRDQRGRRQVDPLRVFADQGAWYLVGFDHLRGDERVFRVDRIVSVETLDETFAASAEPSSLGMFQPADDDPRVVIEIGRDEAWVAETYPVESVRAVSGDRQQVTIVVGARPWLARLLLRLGPGARVVDDGGDPALATAGTDGARLLLHRYRP
ncbi:MAG: helix-turn-helix transcriptional regulator [Acidimicrobiia bacterium]